MHFNKLLQQQDQIQNANNITTITSAAAPTAIKTITSISLPTHERKTEKLTPTISNNSLNINKYPSSEDSSTSSTDSGVHISDSEAAVGVTATKPTLSTNPLRQQFLKNSDNIKQTTEDKTGDNSYNDDGRDDEKHRATFTRIFDNKFKNEPQLEQSTRNNESNYTQHSNIVQHENLINNNKKSNVQASQLNDDALPRAAINPASRYENVTRTPPLNGFNEPTRAASPCPSSIVYSSDSSDNEPSSRPHHHRHLNRSPAVSIRSIDSSVVDSDSDSDLNGAIEGVHENYVIKKLGTQVSYPPKHPDIPKLNNGLQVINHQITPEGMTGAPAPSPLAVFTQMGDSLGPLMSPHHHNGGQLASPSYGPQIAVSASKDITIGDKHFYEGPVTIQQFLIDRRDKKDDNSSNGKDNPSYEGGGAENCNNAKDINLSPTSELSEKSFAKLLLKNKKSVITVVFIFMVLVISAIVWGVKVANDNKSKKVLGNSEETRKNIPINSTIGIITKPSNPDDIDDIVVEDGKLCLIDRDMWRARPQAGKLDPQTLPLHRVVIAHTASEPCHNQRTCGDRVRNIQNFHMDSFGWDDLGYSFLIGSNGCVYVGRGWDDVGAHTKGYNYDSVGIAFIGTYTNAKPTEVQLNACHLLIEEGVKLKKLVPDYKLYGARQLSATESPGETLYKIIRTWDHWAPNI